ncbi:hypothetical protein Tco_0873149 [Tanacetum coccineum]
MLRLELHIASVLAVGKPNLDLRPRYTSCFSGLIQCSRRCLILKCFNLRRGPTMKITSSGWPFVSAVLGQMAHLVASITLDSARSYVMQSAFLTQGTVSSIPIVFSWGGSISPEGFLSSVLLWLVIIVAVVGVGVTVVVVIIVAVVVVVERFICRQDIRL